MNLSGTAIRECSLLTRLSKSPRMFRSHDRCEQDQGLSGSVRGEVSWFGPAPISQRQQRTVCQSTNPHLLFKLVYLRSIEAYR